VLGISGGGAPYLLVFVIATSTWELFAQAAYWSTRSLELSRRELRTVYVPRIVPLAAAFAPALIEYLIYLGIAAAVVVWYVAADGTFYLEFGPETALVGAGLVLILLLGIGIGLWTAPLAVRARDVRFVLTYVLGFWYFLTPVIYPIEAIPERYRSLASVNPVTAPIEMVKRGLLGFGELPVEAIAISLGTIVALFAGGLYAFARHEAAALDSL
jgi:lipopolysaccharide transport system permease protein